MGHALGDSSTYTRFYMTDYNDVDFQEIVFGSEASTFSNDTTDTRDRWTA